MLTVFFIGLTFLFSTTSIKFLFAKTFEIEQQKEIEQAQLRLEAENIKKHHLFVRDKAN